MGNCDDDQLAEHDLRAVVDVPLRWTYAQIKKEGIDRSGLCKDAGTGDALELCRDNMFGQAVMWAEPEIAALCRAGNPKQDVEVVGDCARRKFMNAAASGIVSAPLPANASISETCNPRAPSKQRIEALRNRLRAALAAARSRGRQSGRSCGRRTSKAVSGFQCTERSSPAVTIRRDRRRRGILQLYGEAGRAWLTDAERVGSHPVRMFGDDCGRRKAESRTEGERPRSLQHECR
jgi:hypothetical protein